MGIGEFNKRVKVEGPTESINDEGGRVVSYAELFNVWARVERSSQKSEANGIYGDSQSITVTVRNSSYWNARNLDWMLVYDNGRYAIESIEKDEEEERFLIIRASAKE